MTVTLPPFAEFEAWLRALPDDHTFAPDDTLWSWSCRCPVATFLTECWGIRAVVHPERIIVCSDPPQHIPVPDDYYNFIFRVDRNMVRNKARAVACVEGGIV